MEVRPQSMWWRFDNDCGEAAVLAATVDERWWRYMRAVVGQESMMWNGAARHLTMRL